MKHQPIKTDERGTAFLIDKLASELLPYQYLRELVQNSIEAGATRIEVGTFWPMVQSDGVYKLSVADNGCGMTPEEMYKYLGKLASSGKTQGLRENFGIGAKVAALASSSAGLTYMSWVNGKGYGITMFRDGDEYVIERQENGDYAVELPNEAKPYVIENHGTVVIMIGQDKADTTSRPDNDFSNSKVNWLPIYFSNRYFRFPDTVRLSLERLPQDRNRWPIEMERGGGDKGHFRTVTGWHKLASSFGKSSGTVQIPGAKVHWYISGKNDTGSTTLRALIGTELIGRTGIVWRDEIYEVTLMPGTIARQQLFGIAAGNSRIAILVEPDEDLVEANAARTRLKVTGENPPWEEWGKHFRAAMPDELADYIKEELNKGTSVSKDEIDQRVREIMRLTNRSRRYKQNDTGDTGADGASPGGIRGLMARMRNNGKEKLTDNLPPDKHKSGGGSILDKFLNKETDNGQQSSRLSDGVAVPEVKWMPATSDNDLEDRAARYDRIANLVTANEGFRLFIDMAKALAEEHRHPNAELTAWGVIKPWYSTVICEAVVRINAMMTGKEGEQWNQDDVEILLSPEGLTASVMSAYLVHQQARKEMASKMRKIIMLPDVEQDAA